MRIHITSFIDVPDDSDVQKIVDTTFCFIIQNMPRNIKLWSKNAEQLINNLQFNFADNSDKE